MRAQQPDNSLMHALAHGRRSCPRPTTTVLTAAHHAVQCQHAKALNELFRKTFQTACISAASRRAGGQAACSMEAGGAARRLASCAAPRAWVGAKAMRPQNEDWGPILHASHRFLISLVDPAVVWDVLMRAAWNCKVALPRSLCLSPAGSAFGHHLTTMRFD